MQISSAITLDPCQFVPAPFVPRATTSVVNRVADFAWETYLGINTRGGAGPTSPFPDSNHYGTLAYHTYFSIFDRIGLGTRDVVVDLGAGKGRVTCIAALHDIKRVVGVEIDPALCEVGQRNADRMRRRRADVEFKCQSATEYDFDSATIITLFNPFGTETMAAVLERIHESFARRPRRIHIAYGNPILAPMMSAKPWLKLYECWVPTKWSRLKFPVHFYRTI